ncbi:MAG: NUDIX domain-containing protein [Chloroflexota bacterium]
MRNQLPVAVHLFFLQQQQLLLLRRFNTGYEDGNYSVVAGHVESDETVTQAAIREAFEEAGVIIATQDIDVVHVMNRKSDDERIDFFLVVNAWAGEVANQEPNKCDDLSWFGVDNLPSNIIPYVKFAFEQYQAGALFSEFGWESEEE